MVLAPHQVEAGQTGPNSRRIAVEAGARHPRVPGRTLELEKSYLSSPSLLGESFSCQKAQGALVSSRARRSLGMPNGAGQDFLGHLSSPGRGRFLLGGRGGGWRGGKSHVGTGAAPWVEGISLGAVAETTTKCPNQKAMPGSRVCRPAGQSGIPRSCGHPSAGRISRNLEKYPKFPSPTPLGHRGEPGTR